MPITRGKDAKGCYYRFGPTGAHYHYVAGDAASRARAKALAARQGRAIEMRKHAGGDLLGLAKKAVNVVKAAPGVIQRGKEALQGRLGVRSGEPPAVRNYLADHRNDEILQMFVAREPIASGINKALNLLSLGQFSREMTKNGYDKMFHLRMFMEVKHAASADKAGNTVYRNQWHMWERNEVLNLVDKGESFKVPADSMPVPLNGKKLTVGQLWDNAVRSDPRIWEYDPISHNCQAFVSTVLKASGLETPALNAFVVQKADNLLPTYGKAVGRWTTDLAATFNHVLHGRGGRFSALKIGAARGGTLPAEKLKRAEMEARKEIEARTRLQEEHARRQKQAKEEFLKKVVAQFRSGSGIPPPRQSTAPMNHLKQSGGRAKPRARLRKR